jgi:hypothetical protein
VSETRGTDTEAAEDSEATGIARSEVAGDEEEAEETFEWSSLFSQQTSQNSHHYTHEERITIHAYTVVQTR